MHVEIMFYRVKFYGQPSWGDSIFLFDGFPDILSHGVSALQPYEVSTFMTAYGPTYKL